MPSAISWLQDNSIPLEELSYLSYAYVVLSQLQPSCHPQLLPLFAALEASLFTNAPHLKVQEALALIHSAHAYASEDLVELLDRLIGANIYEVPAPALVMSVKAFLAAKNPRPKIFEALFKRLEDCAKELTLQEVCELAEFLPVFLGEFDHMYGVLEPYILSRIHSLTEEDLLHASHAYLNPSLGTRYELANVLEATILTQSDRMSLHVAAHLLYFFAKNRCGSRVLIEGLTRRLEKDNDFK